MRTRGINRPAVRRPGYVLVMVLIVIVIVSLAAYKFTDLMTAKSREAVRMNDAAQARLAAISGVHYAAAALGDPNTLSNIGGNPFIANTFTPQMVRQGDSPRSQAWFSLVSVAEVSQGVYQQQYGSVEDEAGKININALIILDPTGTVLFNALMMLPNMTQPIAAAIVDWVDADDIQFQAPSGATGFETTDYQGLGSPYQAKNGPLNSLDELLLVNGVTPTLLYGNDRNRNGLQDDDPTGGSTLDRGWAPYLTVYGRELNLDSTNTPRTNVNDTADMPTLYQNLITAVGQSLADYIMAYKMFNVSLVPTTSTSSSSNSSGSTTSSSTSSTSSTSNTSNAAALTAAVQTALGATSPTAVRSFVTVLDMLNTQVLIPGTPATAGMAATPAVVVPCPLNDPTQIAQLLPVLLDKATATTAVELPPRLNINTAPYEVLMALVNTNPISSGGSSSSTAASAAASSSSSSSTAASAVASATSSSSTASTTMLADGSAAASGILSETDVENIIAARDALSPSDPGTQSGAWLLTTGTITSTQFQLLQPFITGRTMVYRVQSIGYFAQGTTTARVEAVVDANQGSPRILYFRDLTALDNPRGFPQPPSQ